MARSIPGYDRVIKLQPTSQRRYMQQMKQQGIPCTEALAADAALTSIAGAIAERRITEAAANLAIRELALRLVAAARGRRGVA